VSLLLALAAGEFALRAVGVGTRDLNPVDARTGLRTYPPNREIPLRTACFENTIRTNASGFHAREHAQQKPPGTFRIVILGDSFVAAAEVDRDRSFSARLEDLLNASASGTRFEVIPVGMPGNGTFANLQYLAAYGLAFQPDLVLDIYNINDLENDAFDNTIPLRTAAIRDTVLSGTVGVAPARAGDVSPARAWIKGTAQKSALMVTAYTAYLNIKARASAAPSANTGTATPPPLTPASMYLVDPPQEVLAAWDRQASLLAAMRDIAAHAGARFAVASLTADNRVNEVHYQESLPSLPPGAVTDPYALETRLTAIAEQLEVAYLPTVSAFSTLRMASGPAAWPCDGHYNEAGNTYFSQVLYDGLRQNSGLLSSD
jgi:hypothetical protein